MATAQLRAVIPFRTGLPADVSVNTFSVIAADLTEGSRTELLNAVQSFYIDGFTSPTQGPLGGWFSPAVNRNALAARIELYEVDPGSGLAGTPIELRQFTIPVGPGAADDLLPNEVAICSSFAAGAPAGTSAARRRGRIYFGPLRDTSITNDPLTFQPIVATSLRETLLRATERLAETLLSQGHELSVWSRTDGAFFPVVRGWVDNEFDTQRRRGEVATSRLLWSLG